MPKEWNYDGSWDRYPIKPGERWNVGGNSIVAQWDIMQPLPSWMRAEVVFVDPPWGLGNLNTFYTKAQRTDKHGSYTPFVDAVFRSLVNTHAHTAYIEMGVKYAGDIQKRLEALFPVVQSWNVVYYKKHPCVILRGGQRATAANYTGMDEMDVIGAVAANEEYNTIADFCMGRGGVGVAAFKAGRRFVGTELNPKRLACLLTKVVALGGTVARIEE